MKLVNWVCAICQHLTITGTEESFNRWSRDLHPTCVHTHTCICMYGTVCTNRTCTNTWVPTLYILVPVHVPHHVCNLLIVTLIRVKNQLRVQVQVPLYLLQAHVLCVYTGTVVHVHFTAHFTFTCTVAKFIKVTFSLYLYFYFIMFV